MLTAEEAAELRSLQERAYAPDGELAGADAERLRELEQRRARRGAPLAAPAPELAEPAEPAELVEARGLRAPLTDPAEAQSYGPLAELVASQQLAEPAALAEPVEARGIRGLLRRRWVPFAASALALVIGFGAGWLIFAGGAQAIALDAATAGQQATLNADDRFDAGSVVLVGVDDDLTIWQASGGEGATQCVILTRGDEDAVGCVPIEEFDDTGVNAVLFGDEEQISAGLMLALDGRIAAFVQRYEVGGAWDWRSQYTDDELVVVDRLIAQGYDGEMLQLIGYDGETPVWFQWKDNGSCVILSTPDRTGEACAADLSDPVALSAPGPDGSTTTYVVVQSGSRGPLLTIERGPAAASEEASGDAG